MYELMENFKQNYDIIALTAVWAWQVFLTHSVPHIHLSLFPEMIDDIDCATTNFSRVANVHSIIQFKGEIQKQKSQTLFCL